MRIKNLVLSCLAAAFALSLTSFAAFERINTYTQDIFDDVPSTAWYSKEVANTYELGLMNGKGNGIFEPSGNVTLAEAITMASRCCAIHNGEEIQPSEGTWYKMYVDYAMKKGFVKDGQFDSYTRNASRSEVAQIFKNAMPDGYFPEINDVEKLHDVPCDMLSYDDILTLYRAGIVMGSDEYGTFRPYDSITRAEAAAIINRVALPENRISGKLKAVSEDDAYTLANTTDFNSQKEGINSGWILDNRGGVPRKSVDGGYNAHVDISTTAGVALIREFNETSTGVFDVLCDFSVTNPEGFYIEFQNTKGNSIYKAEIKNGKWCILSKNGIFTEIYDTAKCDGGYVFAIKLDLDNGAATTVINGENCGTFDLAADEEDINLYNFRFATTEESLAAFNVAKFAAHANYGIYEDFSSAKVYLCDSWILGEGACVQGSLSNEALSLNHNASANVSFAPISGNIVAEFHLLLPQGENVSYTLNSNGKETVRFTTDSKSFYVNGTKVYDYVSNLWYRLRFEFDTHNCLVNVKINGRNIAVVDFVNKASYVDNFVVYNGSQTAVSFDNFKVFALQEHEDYVPEPVSPAGDEDYLIGINVCSLWKNGSHYGWHCITPYDDRQSVLGYYDEGSAETADWEIKYMTEHGIDFQAFCVFVYGKNPINMGADHLFDGFMNAKYRDMVEFCVILEAANSDNPSSLEDWKERWVPYLIENFIKHERQVIIDNKPLMCMFGPDAFSKQIGGNDVMKQALDYMEGEVQKLGFDGMIYLCCGSSEKKLSDMGFDGCYAYNWGTNGYKKQVNISSITQSAADKSVYTVPTVSVGFNSIPWHGERYPLMSKTDYKETNEWIRDEYLKNSGTEDWQKNLVMLSTWNEYGEGTYIMPVRGEGGFGYLDVIREVYTKEKAENSINVVPTENQLYRINHLYPQYRRLLRREGYLNFGIGDEEVDISKFDLLGALDFEHMNVANLWNVDKASVVQDENGVTGKGTTSDPIIMFSKLGFEANAKDVKAIKFTAKVPENSVMQIRYTTTDSEGWDEVKCKTLTSASDDMTDYVFSTSSLKNWSGSVTRIRIDPVGVADTEFTVKALEFYGTQETVPAESLKEVYTLPLTELENSAFWNTTVVSRGDKGVIGKAATDDPIVMFTNLSEKAVADDISAIVIKAKIPSGTTAHIYFTTDSSQGWDEKKKKSFTSRSDEMTEYVLLTEGISGWNGLIKKFRFDPVSAKQETFVIESIRFCSIPGMLSQNIVIDGDELKQNYMPTMTQNEDILIAFDVSLALDFRLGLFHIWDRETKSLTLKSDKHIMVFTVGKNSYTLDGKEQRLSYVIEETDGLILVPINIVCEKMGYEYELTSKGVVEISTPYKAYYDLLNTPSQEGRWEFDIAGNTQKWTSSYMSLVASGGYLSCQSLANSHNINDPVINLSDSTLSLNTKKYSALEIKARYSFVSEKPQYLAMYFVTDKDTKLNEAKTVKIPYENTSSGNDWVILRYDLTQHEKWQDTVTKLRLDPFNASGHIDIDYIRFIENPNYEQAVQQKYKLPEGVDKEHKDFGELIWYNDFETSVNTDAVYADETLDFACGGVSAETSVCDNPVGSGKALKVVPSGNHGGFQIAFNQALSEDGVYTFIADVMIPEGADTTSWTRYGVTLADGTKKDPNSWKSAEYIKENGKWFEYPSNITVAAGNQVINNWSFRKSKPEEYYLDNVRVYFREN